MELSSRFGSDGIEQPQISLAYLPPTPRQTRVALAGAAVLLLGLAVLIPFAGTPLPKANGFIPALDAIIFVTDLITAGLLLAHFSITRSRALCALGVGYLFSAAIVVVHALTFPGAFSPTGNLGGSSHTNFRIYLLWHVGLPVAVLAYVWLRDEDRSKAGAPTPTEIAAICGAAIALALVSCIACLALVPPVDPIAGRWLTTITMLICAAALSLLWVFQRSALDQWLMVVVLAMIVELAITALIGGLGPSMVTLGFYTGRLFSLVTSTVVLTALLAETTRLYAGLARANMLASVVKASQSLSSEIVSPKLIERLMKIAIGNAGADRGLLILPSGDEYLIQAQAHAIGDQIEVTTRQEPISPIACPESLVRHVIRTRESVILDDASTPGPFSGDDYLRDRQAKSILCLPLIKQRKLTGILLLENTSTSHAFTPARIALLELLAAQAAISLENTRLYSDLEERESKVRRLVDSNIIGICIFDLDGRIIEANEAFLRIVGHGRDEILSDHFRWTSLTPPEFRRVDEQAFAEVASTGTCRPYEKDLFRKDGSRVPVLVGGATFGELRHQGVAFVVDLTEQKRAEAEVRRAHAQLADEKHLLEMTASGRALDEVLSAVCRFVEKNSPECLCGVYPIDWSGTVFKYGVAPSLPLSFIEPIKGSPLAVDKAPCGVAVAEDRQVIVIDVETDPIWRGTEYRDHLVSHGLRSVWSTLIGSQDKRVLGSFCIYQREPATPTAHHQELIAHATHVASIALDRSQRDESMTAQEVKLRRAYDYLTEAQRLSKTGSFTWDVFADEHNWSDEIRRIFGFGPDVQVTMGLIQAAVHPDDMAEVVRVIGGAAEGRGFDLVFRILTTDGEVRHAHVVGHRIEQITDRMVFLGALQDVTDRKVAEERLDRARRELAHVSRVTTLSALTASIAHEVNQPLAGIIANASTCLRLLAADPPSIEGAQATAQRTIRDANRASEVIKRLRALFARRPAASAPLDLNDAAREVLTLASTELEGARVVLQIDLADGLPTIVGDRVQLQQVILNLVLNAAEAMQTVDDRPRELSISTVLDGDDHLRLSVRDRGVGADAEQLGQLFNAFYTTKKEGMGVGLSISRSIIEAHGGRISAAGNDGAGLTFSVFLPVTLSLPASAEDGADTAPTPPRMHRSGKPHARA